MKYILVILLFCSFSGFAQNIPVSGFDTTTGSPGKKYTLKPLRFASPLFALNDSTAAIDTSKFTVNTFALNGSSDSTILTMKSGLRFAAKVPTSGAGGGQADSAYFWNRNGNSIATGLFNKLGTNNNRSLPFFTNNTARMIIDSLGNVGIGTIAPETQLHLKPNSFSSFWMESNATAGNYVEFVGGQTPITSGNYYTFLRYNNASSGALLPGVLQIGNPTKKIVISTTQSGGAFIQEFVLDAGGKVGIGIPTPTRFLDVASTSGEVAGFQRTTNSNSITQTNITLYHKYTGDMSDGFGPALSYRIGDNAAVENELYQTAAVRAGADGTGDYIGGKASSGIMTEQWRFTNAGSLGIGVTPAATALLDLTSTTKGLLPPRMTTTQRNAISSPAEGLTVYDETLHKLYVYDGTVWQACW